MNELNVIFLEKYKHLDKLCCDMFGTEKGVTDYINSARNNIYLQNNADIKTLVRLRHIRNQLGHDIDAFNTPMCSQRDIDWLDDFYKKVYNVSDPLSLSFKPKYTTKNIVCVDSNTQDQTYTYSKNKGNALPVFLGIALAIITATLLYFIFLK